MDKELRTLLISRPAMASRWLKESIKDIDEDRVELRALLRHAARHRQGLVYATLLARQTDIEIRRDSLMTALIELEDGSKETADG